MIAFAVLLVVHGAIHLLGAAKAFGWADLPELTQPISPAFGALWLASALLFLAAAASLFVWPRGWRAIGAIAIVTSTIVIVPSWADAKVGAVVNAVVFVGVALLSLQRRPLDAGEPATLIDDMHGTVERDTEQRTRAR